MNLRRAFTISAVSYIVTFLVTYAVLWMLGIRISIETGPTSSIILVSMIVAIVLTVAAAYWYFRPASIVANTKQGWYFGLVAVVIAMVLDGVIALLLELQGYSAAVFLESAYTHWFLFPMFFLGLAGTALVGKVIGRRKEKTAWFASGK